jgi:hypothetical protein
MRIDTSKIEKELLTRYRGLSLHDVKIEIQPEVIGDGLIFRYEITNDRLETHLGVYKILLVIISDSTFFIENIIRNTIENKIKAVIV